MRKQKNILLPILTLLVLLSYPGMIKIVHVHHSKHFINRQGKGTMIIQKEDPCAVCNFQFVSFIGSQTELISTKREPIDVTNRKVPERLYTRYLTYFSLRAPPEA